MSLDFKLRKVLTLYGLLLFCLLVRVWFLSVINYDKMQKLSVLPRRKTLQIPPSRGLITAQDGKLLASNKRRFNIAICYQDIKRVPQYEIYLENGQKTKYPKRKTYIQDLAKLLSEHTAQSVEDIEDFIYAKAALFQDAHLVLKENISEKSYHILKLLEKDWPGLKIQIDQTRNYPQGKLACHVVGYLGSVDASTYKKANEEKKLLKEYIDARERGLSPPLPKGFNNPFEVRERLNELLAKSYNLQDLVGKDGIEKSFDDLLRGGYGKKFVEVTRLGHFISELPGSYDKLKPAHIELSLDLELQKKAEMLLAERESTDELFPKGGACVVIDLKTSKVIALASYPRFDPQDFIDKNGDNIHKWTESSSYLKKIYQGILDIEKEKFSTKAGFFISKTKLDFKNFLDRLLSSSSSCRQKLLNFSSVKDAFLILDSFEKLHEKFSFINPKDMLEQLEKDKDLDEESLVLYEPIKKHLKDLQDPLLLLDILKLQIDTKKFSARSLNFFDKLSLDEFFKLGQNIAILESYLEKSLKKTFDETLFSVWRTTHFKEFLKRKRQEEIQKATYARPYTEYLTQEKNRQFKQFLHRYRKYFTAYLLGKLPSFKQELSSFKTPLSELKNLECLKELIHVFKDLDLELLSDVLKSIRSFEELNRPLYGNYPRLLEKKKHFEKDLALAFYPKYKLGYLRSHAYRYPAPPGSVFKIAVAYEALKERLFGKSQKLPIIQDALGPSIKNKKDQILGYDELHHPIKRWHKGGLLPRSSHSGIGKVDVIGALEQSSNVYFSLLASDYIQDPQDLLETTLTMGFGRKTGIELPYEAMGRLPDDLCNNKTGLYAFAIGQHEFLVTPLQTSLMMSSLFSGGQVSQPQLVSRIKKHQKNISNLFDQHSFDPLNAELANLGCHFPLFTETCAKHESYVDEIVPKKITSHYFVNESLLQPIKKGLDRVLWGEKGTARPQAVATLLPGAEFQQYMRQKHKLIGKTGTAEQRVIETLDSEAQSRMLNHIWFAAVSFKDESQKEPELAICVYLKDGKVGGKEAAPIAAKLAEAYQQRQKK